MAIKTYLLYCEICNYKKITNASGDSLTEIKTSPLMTEAPKLDPETKRGKPAKFKSQKKRFKCPKCGRAIFPRKLQGAEKQDEEDNNTGHQTGDEGRKVQEEPSSDSSR
jgi:predicted RNA-binding Zn-ribbon protein involved in translation (DUF1610 family)